MCVCVCKVEKLLFLDYAFAKMKTATTEKNNVNGMDFIFIFAIYFWCVIQCKNVRKSLTNHKITCIRCEHNKKLIRRIIFDLFAFEFIYIILTFNKHQNQFSLIYQNIHRINQMFY